LIWGGGCGILSAKLKNINFYEDEFMGDYLIAVASTADVTLEFLQEHNIPFISYSYTLENNVYEDNCREDARQEAYTQMRQGKIYTTSMINTNTYYEFLSGLINQAKDVIYLDMSKEMSSYYISLQQAGEQIREEHPDRKLYIMDTLCISGGLGLLLEHMVFAATRMARALTSLSSGARRTS